LDQIGLLIETYGVGVCQPSPSKALKEIASNISDRDKSVRSAALNAIVAAYNVSGDIVLKQVGRVSTKKLYVKVILTIFTISCYQFSI